MALLLYGRRALLSRKLPIKTSRRNGYIVLVPEIGEDLPEQNPLLQQNGLPEFSTITIENCMSAIAKQTLDFESNVLKIEDTLAGKAACDVFSDVLDPLERISAPLDITWGLSKTLYLGNSTLMPTKSYLSIHDRAKRARAAKFNSKRIYEAVSAALESRASDDKPEANPSAEEQHRVLLKFQLEGKLNGLGLQPHKLDQLRATLTKLTAEREKFHTKNEISTRRFSCRLSDPVAVKGFPRELLARMGGEVGPWQVTLDQQVYEPFMEYCPVREMRWNVWQAMVGRGSGYGDKELTTSTHVEGIRLLRRDCAKLLGYESFAAMSMETKMAQSVASVQTLLTSLNEHVQPLAQGEYDTLMRFAGESSGAAAMDRLELWDIPYWRRKHRHALYHHPDISTHSFHLPAVLNALFHLTRRLFGVVVTARQPQPQQAWHRDVVLYDLHDEGSGEVLGSFYMDPHSGGGGGSGSGGSGGGVWMVGIQNNSRVTGGRPLAALIVSLSGGATSSTLSLDDVQRLFHKFGAVLQHCLSTTWYAEVGGVSNLEWDVVHVTGHLMTHFLYRRDVLTSIMTPSSLPSRGGSSSSEEEEEDVDRLHKAMLSARSHCSHLSLARELYLSALDLSLHSTPTQSTPPFWLEVVRKLWPLYRSPFPLLKHDSHVCSFSAIFTEEWGGASYYSGLWGRILAADIYDAFPTTTDDNVDGSSDVTVKSVGRRFREVYLEKGGACDPNQQFRRFRGRDFTTQPLLNLLANKNSLSSSSSSSNDSNVNNNANLENSSNEVKNAAI